MITAFVDENAMNALAGLKTESDESSKQNITVEFIDAAPLTAEVVYNNADAEITIYVRDEMHTNENIAFQATVSAGNVSSDEETVEVAYAVSEGINSILKEKGMLEECTKLDGEIQGVLFGVDKNDDITVKIVEGKKRPSLLCTTLFGAPRMMRPYADEIMSQFEMGSMSFEEMEEAANEGDSDAMEQLAMAYLNGNDEIEENPEKAYYWFVKCAESGNDQAMFNVGLFTAKGFGTERDFAKAAEWMRRASEAGDDDAEACAIEYEKLAVAVEKAKSGDAQAQADLAGGLMKLGGSLDQAGEGKDYEESVMWAEKAVAQGNADGYWTLALAYHHGRGVNKDINKAIEMYQKGAEAGSDSCKHNLACEYMTGENINKDQKKAFALIKEAAENGYGLAMRDLGRCYQFANGTPGNMKKAVEWYEKALEVIDDPELAQKTAMFKMMADADPDFGEDYPESEDDAELDLANLPEDYLAALEDVKAEIEAESDDEVSDKENNAVTESDEELSKEEAMDALKNGQGVLKQVVTKADGTKKEVAIWGGYELDGYDRTLNVFMNQSDIGRFFQMITEDEINLDGVLDPCDQEIGFQITVDFMDCAAMYILRKGEGKLTAEMYVRDERKTCQNIVEAGTGEFDLSEDGTLSVDKETLVENKFLVYALGILGLRKYLLKERIVHKLYNMFDEAAGVEIKVSKGGAVTAKIVKGMERPDLPCEVFLFGEQICRPYFDELLGLKSTGIRKPRDPEFAAKLKAAEEKAQREEEEKKAAEEKARKEAEAKRLEEEQKAKEAAEAKKKQEMDDWKAKADKIKQNREAERSKRLEQYENEYKSSMARIQSKKDSDISDARKRIADLREKIERDNTELAGLGIFMFGRKKELRLIIENDTKTISDIESSIPTIEKKASEEIATAEKNYKQKKDNLDSELDKEFVIPDSPEEIERKRQEEEYRKAHMTKTEKENERIKEVILEALACSFEPMSIVDLQKNDYELGSLSNQKVSALVRRLVDEGKVKKVIEGKVSKFELA